MDRRALLAALSGAAMQIAATPQTSPENAFAEAYNEWIRLRMEAPAGTVYAPATRQWKLVEKAWSKLKHSVG